MSRFLVDLTGPRTVSNMSSLDKALPSLRLVTAPREESTHVSGSTTQALPGISGYLFACSSGFY